MFNSTSMIPQWFFFNDLLTILFNFVGIVIVLIFIVTVIRVEHPLYSISNLIGCHTCLAVGLINASIFLNTSVSLINYFRISPLIDRFCYFRGVLFTILSIYVHIAFCLKAFNRFRCIVFNINQRTKFYRQFAFLMFCQISIVFILSLPLIFTDSIEFHRESNLCLITTNKRCQFIFLMLIYFVSILFVSIVYFYILYYVVHLPLLEQCRRKRHFALFRRIPILILMIVTPGLVYLLNVVLWQIFGSIPTSMVKITGLVESFGHTGAVLTIFISNSRLRSKYSRQGQSMKIKRPNSTHRTTKLIVHHASSLVNEKFL